MKSLAKIPEFIFQKTDGFGKPKKCKLANSTEEIRCMLLACVVIFSRHNKHPQHEKIIVQLTPDIVRDVDRPDKELGGMAFRGEGRMISRVFKDHDKTLTILIHEYLHLLGYHYEWVVSTLTNRFKEDIANIASILLSSYYKGAAHLAHANEGMSYHPGDDDLDGYNSEQWGKAEAKWTSKHRKCEVE